jgi:hypothetical protein
VRTSPRPRSSSRVISPASRWKYYTVQSGKLGMMAIMAIQRRGLDAIGLLASSRQLQAKSIRLNEQTEAIEKRAATAQLRSRIVLDRAQCLRGGH